MTSAPHVQQIAPPTSARRYSTLARIDYSDAFVVSRSNAPDRTAEQWARHMLRDAPRGRRISLVAGWTALGLRLHSPWSSEFVLGWEIRRAEPDVLLLGAGPRFGLAGELLFKRQHDDLLFCTLVGLTNPAARMAWSAMTPTHCRVVQSLLVNVSRHATS